MKYLFLTTLFCVVSFFAFSFEEDIGDLFQDLEMIDRIDKELARKTPLLLNYQLQGGYFAMPSARMGNAGNLGFGFSYLPPYRLYSLSFQMFDHVEITGNYWIFHGIIESNFGTRGFGDDADRTANVKFSLLKENDGMPILPEFAIGWNDFLGTKRFNSFYVAATKTIKNLGLEFTLGYGTGRIKGFFAGGAWSPFYKWNTFFKNLSLVAEYDANDYKKHPSEHPQGKNVKSRLNAGIQMRLWDLFHLSASTLRGEKYAASASFHYNFGKTEGFFPKIYDPLPYKAPIDTEAIGQARKQEEFGHQLAYAFKQEALDLYTASLIPGKKDQLWLKVINRRFPEEEQVRDRIESILGSLLPSNIERVTVVVEANGLPVHQYVYSNEELARYRNGAIGEYELNALSPLSEVGKKPSKYDAISLFKRKKSLWKLTFRPIFRSYFGSSTGKFKYDVGLSLGSQGYLFDQIYYSLVGIYSIKSSNQTMGSIDRLNPSQLLNVRSDAILYYQTNSFHVEKGFMQKSWNIGSGLFTRLALGYFEIAYGGLSWETLFYPVQANWAIGLEAAGVLKRKYHGIGFFKKIRKLDGFTPFYKRYYGLQYFLDFYYHFYPLRLDFKFSAGQFLARDKGVRLEMSRTFPSGLTVGTWYTFTNGNDHIGGRTYFDKGFSITMPLDIFMNKSSKTRIGYSMAAWLRDVGAKAETGEQLYPTIYYERFNKEKNYY